MKPPFKSLSRIKVRNLSDGQREEIERLMEALESDITVDEENDLSFLHTFWLAEKLKGKGANRDAMRKIEEITISAAVGKQAGKASTGKAQSKSLHPAGGIEVELKGTKRRIEEVGGGQKLGQTKEQGLGRESIGVQRIQIELEDNPEEAEKYSEKYAALVSDIVKTLKDLEIKLSEDGKSIANEEERFIVEIWGIIYGNLNVNYGENKYGFLSESLESDEKGKIIGEWDCDTTSFLVLDVAKEMGIKGAEIIVVPGHALFKTENFFFETTANEYPTYFPLKEGGRDILHEHYPTVYFATSDSEKIKSIAYECRGNAYFGQGKNDLAIESYNRAIELNPEYVGAYHDRGNAYFIKGEYDLAIADSNMAIKLDPNLAKAYFNRGNAYGNKGKEDLAIADYSMAIESNPRFANAYYNRGNAYLRQGKNDLAIADYSKTIELNPEDTLAYYNRGKAYLLQGKNDLAIYDFSAAIAREPHFADAYFNRAHAFLMKGEHGNAVAGFSTAIELNPGYKIAYLHRSLAYKKLGKDKEAEADLKRYTDLTARKP